MKRGALIVIEGVDRTGKTTQAKVLVENLKKLNIRAEYRNFPARDTAVGKIINDYLQSKSDLPDEVIHLLFSANSWERAKNLIKTLETGTTVIVDRYCYSGVAYSAAKGIDINWSKATDVGLPKPDKVFFFTLPLNIIEQRNGYGNERYEELNFQKQVSKVYTELIEDNWEILDANRSTDNVQDDLLQRTINVINVAEGTDIGKLWIN